MMSSLDLLYSIFLLHCQCQSSPSQEIRYSNFHCKICDPEKQDPSLFPTLYFLLLIRVVLLTQTSLHVVSWFQHPCHIQKTLSLSKCPCFLVLSLSALSSVMFLEPQVERLHCRLTYGTELHESLDLYNSLHLQGKKNIL